MTLVTSTLLIVYFVASFSVQTASGKNANIQVTGQVNQESAVIFATRNSFIEKFKKKCYSSFSKVTTSAVRLKRPLTMNLHLNVL